MSGKEDAPLVLNDAAPCLKDEETRGRAEVAAIGGSKEAALLLANFYLDGAGNSNEQAIRWLRLYYRLSGSASSIIFAQLLLKSAKADEVAEGVEILTTHANGGDLIAIELLADTLLATGKASEAAMWYEVSALSGKVDSMIKLGELLLGGKNEATQSFGALWTLVASKQFGEGTFRHDQLERKALKAVERLRLRAEVVDAFAISVTTSIRKKSAIPN